mmetsp:Transcript_3167/g.6656  ORF Transcript_3167/g.6656 Transcript_3167/m.6656 type:complete len:256 (+) Transcript_3167:262-1029(+)
MYSPTMAACGHSPTMWEAAACNDVPKLASLVRAHPRDISAMDGQLQYTPAIHAAANDSVDALVALVQHGADLRQPGRCGVTCVFAAAVSGSVRALGFLLATATVDVDAECDDETALEWLGLPCETGSVLGSRLHGNRLLAAQMLVLAGAYVETGVIVHRPSREILHEWARFELAAEAGFQTFLMGLDRGVSEAGRPCPLAMVNVDGIPQHVASYLPRRSLRERRRLVRAAWVWTGEALADAGRCEGTCSLPHAVH